MKGFHAGNTKIGLAGYGVLFAACWLFFFLAVPDVLRFWEQNDTLFRFSAHHWHFFDQEPYQVLLYLNSFLMQFGYYTWLGSAVLSLIVCTTAWAFNRFIETVSGSRACFPGMMVACLLLPSFLCYGTLWFLIWLPIFAGGSLWASFSRAGLRYTLQSIVLVGLAWALREYALLGWILYMVSDLIRTKRQGKTRAGQPAFYPKKFRIYAFIPGAILFLAFWLGSTRFAPYPFVPFSEAFCLLGSKTITVFNYPVNYFLPPVAAVCCLWISIGLVLLFIAFHGRFAQRKKHTWLLTGIGLMTACACGLVTYRCAWPIIHFYRADTLCREFRWDEALRALDRQWEEAHRLAYPSHPYNLLTAQTKTALLAARKATDRLFTYPQPAFPLLFPLNLVNQAESFILPAYYTYAGGFSESLHLSYDFITGRTLSYLTIKNVIENSLIVSDTLPASKFIFFLGQSLFHRREAACYLDPDCRNGLPAIVRGQRMLPRTNYTVKAYHPDENARNEYRNNPENPWFYEYYLTLCLLGKQHGRIQEEMPKIRQFYYRGLGPFLAPRHIQEALLANFNYSPVRMEYPVRIEGISRETWNDYWQFIADNHAWKNGKIPFSLLQKKWQHTYWFYDCYLQVSASPVPLAGA